jgi:hypothetical protein
MKAKIVILILAILLPIKFTFAQTHQDNISYVSDLYWSYLNRPPDASGLEFWTSGLDAGQNNFCVEQAFLYCDEYLNLGAPPLNTSTQDYSAFPGESPSTEIIEITGYLKRRDAVGQNLDFISLWYGNVLTIDGLDGKRYRLWYSFPQDISLANRQIDLMTTQTCTYSFDPATGNVINVNF